MAQCVMCNETITNPVSPERMLDSVQQWMWEETPQLLRFFGTIKHTMYRPEEQHETCIVTGEQMGVCPYCVTEHVLDWLKSLEVNPGIITQYLKFFNYDLGHLGYEQEARKQGYIT